MLRSAIDFLSKCWNKGYATEAAKAIKDHAIEKLKIDLRILCSFVSKNSRASQRIAEKIGMQRIIEYIKNGVDYYL